MTTCDRNVHRAAASLSRGCRVRGITLVEMLVVVAVIGGLGLLFLAQFLFELRLDRFCRWQRGHGSR